MRKIVLTFGFLLIGVALIWVNRPVASDARDSYAECEGYESEGLAADRIREIEYAMARTNVEGEVKTPEEARAFYAQEGVAINYFGRIIPFSEIISSFQENSEPTPPWAESFEIVELDVKVYCDMAIAIGLSEGRALNSPADQPPTRIRYTNIWTKRNGKWVYTAHQSIRLEPS